MVLPSGVSAWSRVVHFFTDASLQPVHPEVAHLDVAEGGAQGEVPACIGRPVLEIEDRSEEHTSELQSLRHLVCRLLLEKKKNSQYITDTAAGPGADLGMEGFSVQT